MNNSVLKGALVLLLLGLPSCVPLGGSSGGRSGESMSQQVARHEQQIQGLLGQVGQVEQVLPGQAEMWSQMQTMRQDLNAVRGKVDDMNNQLAGGGAGEMGSLRDRVNRLEAVVRQMASQLAISTEGMDSGASSGAPVMSPSSQNAAPEAQPQVSGAPVDTATALYDSGIKSFDQRRYKDALVAFSDFTSTYPKHKMASYAYFWQGESYFQLSDFARAALAYQEVISKYPSSPKMQPAMLKQGIALYKAGKKDSSKERLNELIKRYPSSPEATRAKQFLASNK